ncbi:hypothetical protein ASE69_10315 [Sphingomonas sp. Leaf208]|jgi:hypothetical protein|uniref:hypothetical protein n=1 Tax=Sphingomonas sp. Leaf208 TaxID=1735679 RepID=UPI0007004DFC|nr:hypothetical protein [Sphingomonas sp. Leaf208]KQM49177.1 hypothetical protein ASE69_10315 [Sphingomonas sp. Leaf208]
MTDGWPSGGRGTGPLTPGAADRAAKRAEERANGREQRAKERLAASEQRSESRAAQRDLQSQERERAREDRRIEEDQRIKARLDAPPTNDVEALKISKRRRSGALARSGEESKTDRDTRSYKTIVDTVRIRTLADRGASVAGLAGAFGITIEEVEAALLETAPQD